MHAENEHPRDDLEGLTETMGDAALFAAASTERAARAGGEDPIGDLTERVRAGDEARAFAPAVLDAVARLRVEDPAAFVALRAALKVAKGFSLTSWAKAVDARAAEHKRAEKARATHDARERAAAAREALTRARAEASQATARARSAAAAEVAAHHAEHAVDDDAGVRFVMEPGRISAERPLSGGRVETRTLASFSAAIVADVHELDAPDAAPRRAFDLSVMLPGDTAPRRVEGVPADEFRGMQWPESRVGARAVVHDTGRRDDLRVAVQSMSSPLAVYRYRFTGWTMHQGRPVYLHAGGAIGEEGPVAGIRAEATAPANRFDLGAEGVTPARGVAAVLELLSVTPADVIVPMVCAAFRAVMGASRLTVHLSGRTSTGKSLLAGLVQSLFGRTFHGEALPASWADGSTANGIARVLSRVGDAVVVVDDLRFGGGMGDVRVSELFDRVTRAQFNGAAPVKLTRDGGQRVDPPSRCVVLSTGETPPRQHSTRNRVVCLELNERPAPELGPLVQRAAAGELAAGMATFVQWYASRYAGNLPRLPALERAAAARWCLGVTDRAAGLFGALALGAEVLFAWLAESGVAAAVVAEHEARARAALADVARVHGEGVEAENPARRFVPLLRDALAAGEAHIKALVPGGRTDAPADAELWGWRTDGPDGPRQQGKAVGWTKGAEVYINPGVALDVVKTRAQRSGDPFPVSPAALARDLHAAGLLARTDLAAAEARVACRVRVGAGCQPRVLVFSLEAFGVEVSTVAGDESSSDAAPSAPFDHPAEA
jgi:hypothetical protein